MNQTIEAHSVTVHGERFVPYISENEIQQRVGEIALELEQMYEGTRPIALCVLNGAFMFFSDLLRKMSVDCEIDFAKVSSYGKEQTTSKDVKFVLSPTSDMKGRDVILVEDIVDSGYTIDFLKKYLEQQDIASLKVVALLHKPERTLIPQAIDFIGFSIPDNFVVGYGLDYDQHARYLPSIYISNKSNGFAEE